MNVISRRETKYELNAKAASGLCELIGSHLPVFEYRSGFRFTYVTTVYFDTDELDFFRRARDDQRDNVKVRVREYAYRIDGQAMAPLVDCFLEVKRRIGDGVVKQRLRLPKRLLQPVVDGEDIWEDLVSAGAEYVTDSQSKAYSELRSFLQVYLLLPRSIIRYRRKVYQLKESELRITFDDELSIHHPRSALYEDSETLLPVHGRSAGHNLDKVIMEIKCRAEYPEWLGKLLAHFAPSSISKFTESMSALVT